METKTNRFDGSIELVFNGACDGCTEAEPLLTPMRMIDGKKFWSVSCLHEGACIRTYESLAKEGE